MQRRFHDSGITFVEFALTVWLIMMFLIMGTDLIRYGYFTTTAQLVLNRAVRQGSVGTTGDNPSSSKTPAQRADDLAQSIVDIGQVFGINLTGSDTEITVCPLPPMGAVATPCPPGNRDAGTHKDFIRVTLKKPFYFFWKGLRYDVLLTTVSKNEPF